MCNIMCLVADRNKTPSMSALKIEKEVVFCVTRKDIKNRYRLSAQANEQGNLYPVDYGC